MSASPAPATTHRSCTLNPVTYVVPVSDNVCGCRTGASPRSPVQHPSMSARPFVTPHPLAPVSPERPKAAQAEPVCYRKSRRPHGRSYSLGRLSIVELVDLHRPVGELCD